MLAETLINIFSLAFRTVLSSTFKEIVMFDSFFLDTRWDYINLVIVSYADAAAHSGNPVGIEFWQDY